MNTNDAIERFVAGRLILSAKDIQECFRLARGQAVSRTTLDGWEGDGLFVEWIRGRKWYSWDSTWAFYLGKINRTPPRGGRRHR